MQGSLGGADLQLALEARVPYDFLPAPLQQRLTPTQYKEKAIDYGVLRCHGYHRLPDHIRATTTEKEYYEKMVTIASQSLQLYPYAHQDCLVHFTKETALSYYTNMMAELLKAERSYDRLPNFTAIDILNLLGIGRNQYLNLTREVRSKVRWHINRSYVADHLPSQMLDSVSLDPFSRVTAVEKPSEVIKKMQAQQLLSLEALTLYRLLCKKGAQSSLGSAGVTLTASLALPPSFAASEVFYACELPYAPLHTLHRCGLVYTTDSVDPDDCLVIPPLGDQFVMNRTSEEPMEVLLYRLLSTVDEQTPMSLLAQLLMLNEEDVCVGAQLLVQLRLAYLCQPRVPEKIQTAPSLDEVVHASWKQPVQRELDRLAAHNDAAAVAARARSANQAQNRATSSLSAEDASSGARAGPAESGHPLKRIALLYDATLTGFLMMTNLSRDPTFKQLAVTLFEVGRMPSHMVGALLALLEKVDVAAQTHFGGEAQTYLSSVFCLRELLRALTTIEGPGDTAVGVDMLKIESLNELEATTRYSVLGRHYWAYVVTAPLACAPLLDIELSNVYGSTVSFMPSPWLLLFLYAKTGHGPPCALLPFGTMLSRWPSAFTDAEEVLSEDEHDHSHSAEDGEESRAVNESESPRLATDTTTCTPHEYHDGTSRCGSGSVVVGYNVHLRMQAMTLGAEVSYAPVSTSLVLAGEMTATAPLFVQCCARTPLLRRRDETVQPHPQYAHKEVLLPFTGCTAEEVRGLALAKITGVAAVDDASATQTAVLVDADDLLFSLVQDSAEALHVTHSLGYFTVCITYERHSGAAESGARPQEDASRSTSPHYYLRAAHVVGVQLGVPLTDVLCCRLMVRSLASRLSETESDQHNAAMRQCVGEFGAFLERYSPLTRVVHSKLALQSSSAGGPMTQLHLRRNGGVGGSPFPTSSLVFDGRAITVVEDYNPLSDQW